MLSMAFLTCVLFATGFVLITTPYIFLQIMGGIIFGIGFLPSISMLNEKYHWIRMAEEK
jgi:hypothetical protein